MDRGASRQSAAHIKLHISETLFIKDAVANLFPEKRLKDIVQIAQQRLKEAGVDDPQFDTRLLAAHALSCNRMQIMMQAERIMTAEEIAAVYRLIDRRAAREPVARIIGEREFWGLPIALNEATLEPRPDSETLVEAALTKMEGLTSSAKLSAEAMAKTKSLALNILDLGSGSGCLLLALLSKWPNATGLGIDISPRAVEQARINAERLGLADRAAFRVNYWLEGLGETFDVIISNPPYVASGDIPNLMPEVRNFDPHEALDGGADGLDVYRFLIPQLPLFLNPNGFAIFEVGQGQAEAVCGLFRGAGFANVATHTDLGGVMRCVAAAWT